MHQSIKLTDAIWLLQLVISSPHMHSLCDLSQASTGIWTRAPSLRGGRLTNWAIPPPKGIHILWVILHSIGRGHTWSSQRSCWLLYVNASWFGKVILVVWCSQHSGDTTWPTQIQHGDHNPFIKFYILKIR